MSFDGIEATLAVLVKIVFPSKSIYFCEAGTVIFDGNTYTPEDDDFGTITGFEDFRSGDADESPEFNIEWTPPSTSAAATLSSPAYQGSPFTLYMVSLNRATGAVLTSKRLFAGQVDSTELTLDLRSRTLKMTITTDMDLFFNTDKGNRLNGGFHKSIWSGETGLDMTTGTTVPVPWGDKSPARSTSGGGAASPTTGGLGRLVVF